jgi:hypothetical protein
MPAENVFPLTLRLAGGKLLASRFTVALWAALPAFLAFLGLRDSPDSAMKIFLLFFPYLFLIAAQDLAGTELGGGLENVLFLSGRFRTYLWQKNLALAATAAAPASVLFVLLSLWTVAGGTFEPGLALQFGLGLLAGFYYVGLAGLLSYRLKAGSNVVAILLVQAAGLLGMILSATPRTGFVDFLGTGRFPDLGSRLLFFGFTAVFPNLIVSKRLFQGALAVVAGLALTLFLQRVRIRRLDLRR